MIRKIFSFIFLLSILTACGASAIATGAAMPTATFTPTPFSQLAAFTPTPKPSLPISERANPTPTPLVTDKPLTATPTLPPAPTVLATRNTLTVTPTLSPAPTLPLLAPASTPTLSVNVEAPPPAPTPCPYMPDAGYRTLLAGEAELQLALGCPTEFHPRVTPQAWELETAYQAFEGGEMIWTSRQVGWYGPPFIYILYPDGTYESFPDTFDPAVDPIKGGEMPPAGRVEPAYGFGKIWREQPEVRQKLGWAMAEEVAGIGASQQFVGGHLLWLNQTNRTYALMNDGTKRAFDIPYAN